MVIDDHVKLYRSGGCFAMAMGLHRLTKLPIRVIDYGGFVHAFVMTPAGEVLDIHGLHSWPAFLQLVVREGSALPAFAVAANSVSHHPFPEEPPILWRHAGYKRPSETGIRRAIAVALSHPNLAGVLAQRIAE